MTRVAPEPEGIIIAVDFDGVICKHAEFPLVGKSVPHAIEWLQRYKELGARLFLWTCRNNEPLATAIAHIESHDLVLDGYNEIDYASGLFAPKPKLFANMYIDDAAIGAPLIYPEDARAYLNWNVVGPKVEARIMNKQRHI